MTIRPALPDDAEAIGRYHQRAWLEVYAEHLTAENPPPLDEAGRIEQWQEWLTGQQANRDESKLQRADAAATAMITMVLDIDDQPIAHTSVGPSSHDALIGELFQLYVDPDSHRSGVGSRLLAAAERTLRIAGFTEAVLWTLETNKRAIGFYEKAGWALDGQRLLTDPWGFPTPVVRLAKPLTEADHLRHNQNYWDEVSSSQPSQVMDAWRSEPSWGILSAPEADLQLLGDLDGLDVVELGCGVGYVSAWCKRLGARSVVGLDYSPVQLATAAQFQTEFDLPFPLVRANGEQPPFADASFDLVVSEYGASIWCDPDRWLPEAARVLRPGGRLVFLVNSVLMMLCSPDFEADGSATPSLVRPQKNMRRTEFPDDESVGFHISHGDMIKALRASGFEILDLVELYAEPDLETPYPFLQGEWASRWPAEEIWVAGKPRDDAETLGR